MFRSGNSDLSMQRMIDPAKAGVKIKQALKEASGNVTAAARKLGVSKMTLYRWIEATPELKAYVDKRRDIRDVFCVAPRCKFRGKPARESCHRKNHAYSTQSGAVAEARARKTAAS